MAFNNPNGKLFKLTWSSMVFSYLPKFEAFVNHLEGLSQEDLADSLGVSRQAISRWEQGNTFPDLLNLQKIMKVFGVSADYLICDEYAAEGNNDDLPAPETDKLQSQFDFKANRFLIIGFLWVFAALCFLITAIDTMNILYVVLALADIILACINFVLHFRNKK